MMTHILQVRRRLYPDKTDELFEAIHSLATTYGDEGKYAAAEPLAQEALGIARRLHGDDHPDTLKVLRALVVNQPLEERFRPSREVASRGAGRRQANSGRGQSAHTDRHE